VPSFDLAKVATGRVLRLRFAVPVWIAVRCGRRLVGVGAFPAVVANGPLLGPAGVLWMHALPAELR